MENFPILKINAEQKFLPLVISFIENSSKGYSFSEKETTALVLASEEIFSYLCRVNKESLIEIECISKNYLIEVVWKFSRKNFNPRAFNITCKINPDDDSSLEEMGLLIANRITDNFNMQEEGNEIIISFSKYRTYPEIKQGIYNPSGLKELKIINPEKQQIILLSEIIRQGADAETLPSFLNSPYMLADMFAQKDIEAKILAGENGIVAGGVLWKKAGNETCEMFGPFVHINFDQEKYSLELTNSCIESIGKENYKGLLCLYQGQNFPQQFFEEIGEYSGKKIYFRELQEDTGIISWVNEKVSLYIKEQYEKLFLPREVIVVPDYDSSNNKYSVVSSDINRVAGSVKLYPLIYGADIKNNIREHINLFMEENLKEIFFEFDLGINFHALFVSALLENNFIPSFIIPCGGRGDLLMMQYSSQNKDEE